MATQQKPAARTAAPAKQAAKPAARPTATAQNQAQAKPQASNPSRPANPTPQAGQQQKAQTTAVVDRQTTALTDPNANVPEHIRQSQGRGSENVGMQDMVIPRIELVQALSRCLEEGNAEYIDGAKAGMFYNSVTRELYGSSMFVVPVFFKKQFLNWRDRKKGGGFGGAHDTMEEAQARLAEQETPDEWEAIETAQQIVLVVDPETHTTSEAVLSCARTKMKVSRQWNSLIRMAGFDRFSRVYELFGVDETNAQNQPYKNIGVKLVDFASVPVYKAAEALYDSIASGAITVKVDDTYDDALTPEDSAAPGAQGGDPGPSEY